jgi:hypothetical protein
MTDQVLMGGALATADNLVFFGEGNGDTTTWAPG